MTTSSYTFNTIEILSAIYFWNGEPFCKEALSALKHHFTTEEEEIYSYKNDNINEFIMETLLQITE
jgi:hypothetical protein